MAQKRKSIDVDVVEERGGTTGAAADDDMCANGCGFFANAGTGGMCSKCYREHAAAAAACANGCGFFANAATGGMCSMCYLERQRAADGRADDAVEEEMTQAVFETLPPPPPRTTPPAEKKAKIAACATTVASSSTDDGAGAGADDAAAPQPLSTDPPPSQPQPLLSAEPPQPGPPKPAANRCSACRKKVGLLGFRCCCGETFCGVHRYAEKHDCSFDYKGAGRDRIAKNNPLVLSDKITRI